MKISEKQAKEAIEIYLVTGCYSYNEALAKAIDVIARLYRNEDYMKEEIRTALISHALEDDVEIIL